MREPRKFSVKQLLQEDVQFVIPSYQRGYDWKGDAQVRDLFVDLISCINSEHNNTLFLGTAIFDISKISSEGVVEVIDGQQRFTTLTLILIAARNYARDTLQSEALAQSIQKYISNADPLLEEGCQRLAPSSTVADCYALMCDYEWDGVFKTHIKTSDNKQISIKKQNSKIKPIYEFCLEQINEHCESNDEKFKNLIRQITQNSFLIRIDIEDQVEAFEIFERTNARGKGLEVSDLLKNFLFSKQKEYDEQDVTDVWDEIVENAGSSILRMLKYFWISRRGYVAARDLYRKLRYYAQEVGISNFVDELVDFSRFYKAYHDGTAAGINQWLLGLGFPSNNMYLNEFRRICSVFRLFSITQVIPYVYSIMRAYSRCEQSNSNAKKVLSSLRYLESFHFVNNKVCNRIGNETEKVYADFSESLFYKSDLLILVEIKDWFEKRIADKHEFEASLATLSYSMRNDRNTIRYVYDKIANSGVKDGQRENLLDIEALEGGITASFDIEHLLSQSEATTDSEVDFVHQIGNLIVIPKQINGILGNASFNNKMKMLSEPHKFDNNIKNVPSYLQEFVAEYGNLDSWGKSEISLRTKKVAAEAYECARFKSTYG